MMYLAVFFTQNSTYGPLLGEMDFRDGNGRRMTPANAVLDHGIGHWTVGNATDDDVTTYYYDNTGDNAFIAHFTDNAPVASAKFYRGHTSYAAYSPIGIRVYQSETNYGTTESNWPVETKLVDETYEASTVGWTDEYSLVVLPPREPDRVIDWQTVLTDDFSGASLDTDKWTVTGEGTVSTGGQRLIISAPSTGFTYVTDTGKPRRDSEVSMLFYKTAGIGLIGLNSTVVTGNQSTVHADGVSLRWHSGNGALVVDGAVYDSPFPSSTSSAQYVYRVKFDKGILSAKWWLPTETEGEEWNYTADLNSHPAVRAVTQKGNLIIAGTRTASGSPMSTAVDDVELRINPAYESARGVFHGWSVPL